VRILYLDLDTLRPDHLGCYGYHTASISPFAERHGAYHFYAGFNEMHNTGMGGMESAEEVTPGALDWIARNARRDRWFLHLNYWDPHVPYRAPEAFGNPFADQPLPAWLTAEEVARQVALVGYQRPHHKGLTFRRYAGGTYHPVARTGLPPLPRNPTGIETLEDVRAIVDGYDCGVRYMDEHLGRILAALDAQGVLAETAVIVSADHGENLGELGIYGDHVTADDATCRVPLIVRWPGTAGRGHVDRGLHYQLDLAPTIAELHQTEPVAAWDGRSFAPAITARAACGRDFLVLSTGAGTCQRSVRFADGAGDWLYTRTYHDGYNLFPPEQLYNLAEDPHEQRDLAGAHPDLCRDAAHRLAGWQDEMMATMPPGNAEDPLWTVIREGGPSHVRGRLPALLRELEAANRDAAAAELRRRHPSAALP
jgi:arylsulfatase A-like enzyme